MSSPPLIPNLQSLTALFGDDSAKLGVFHEVDEGQLPSIYRRLLAHEHHMTVTVEAHHQQPVQLRVLEARLSDEHYSRKILLELSSKKVVQFGLVRLTLEHLSEPIREQIIAQQAPLGRILIAYNVLRTVRLYSLYRVEVGRELAEHFGVPPGTITYGRTAVIDCNGSPAIELLEIVSPEPE